MDEPARRFSLLLTGLLGIEMRCDGFSSFLLFARAVPAVAGCVAVLLGCAGLGAGRRHGADRRAGLPGCRRRGGGMDAGGHPVAPRLAGACGRADLAGPRGAQRSGASTSRRLHHHQPGALCRTRIAPGRLAHPDAANGQHAADLGVAGGGRGGGHPGGQPAGAAAGRSARSKSRRALPLC